MRQLSKRLVWLLGLAVASSFAACAESEPAHTRKSSGNINNSAVLPISGGAAATTQGDTSESMGSESCVVNADAGQDCSYNDSAGTVCTYQLDAEGVLVFQNCSNPEFGSYNCTRSDSLIECVWTLPDGQACVDRYAVSDYAFVDSTCDYDDPTAPTDEVCTPQEDGSTTCVQSDGRVTCTSTYDVNGVFVAGVCTEGAVTQSCVAEAEQIRCVLSQNGEYVCEDLFDLEGNPITLGCDNGDEGYPTEDEQMPEPTCTTQDDGSQQCSMTDGVTTCEYLIAASGEFVSSSCVAGSQVETCVAVEAGVSCDLYQDGALLCSTVYDVNGELLSTDCR